MTDPEFEPSGLLEEALPEPEEPVVQEQYGYLLPGGRVVPLPPGIDIHDAFVGVTNYNRVNRRTGTDKGTLARRTVTVWQPCELPDRKRRGRQETEEEPTDD